MSTYYDWNFLFQRISLNSDAKFNEDCLNGIYDLFEEIDHP